MKNLVPTSTSKHQTVSADEIAFYYANRIHVLPFLYITFIDQLSNLEQQGKLCLTPTAVLERYHLQLSRRIKARIQRIVRFIA